MGQISSSESLHPPRDSSGITVKLDSNGNQKENRLTMVLNSYACRNGTDVIEPVHTFLDCACDEIEASNKSNKRSPSLVRSASDNLKQQMSRIRRRHPSSTSLLEDFHFSDAQLSLVDGSWHALGARKVPTVAMVYAAAVDTSRLFAHTFGINTEEAAYSRCMHLHPTVQKQAKIMSHFLDLLLHVLTSGDDQGAVKLLRRVGASHSTLAPHAFGNDVLQALTDALQHVLAEECASAARVVAEPVDHAWKCFTQWMVPELKVGLYHAIKTTRCRVVKVGIS